jgi:hypothetical protein
MPLLRFARQICTALIPCLLCGLPGTSLAQQSGEFFKSTVTLESGITVTQYVFLGRGLRAIRAVRCACYEERRETADQISTFRGNRSGSRMKML